MLNSSSPSGEENPSKQIIREMLREWDPEGLIDLGAPEDEYEPEAERVSSRLENIESTSDMIELLRGTFSHMFGREYSGDEGQEPEKRPFRKLRGERT